jgi:hypothetical protein
MIEFKQARHSIRNTDIIRVWVNGRLKAVIYPNDGEDGIKVISRHVQGDPLLSFTKVEDVRGWEFKLEK